MLSEAALDPNFPPQSSLYHYQGSKLPLPSPPAYANISSMLGVTAPPTPISMSTALPPPAHASQRVRKSSSSSSLPSSSKRTRAISNGAGQEHMSSSPMLYPQLSPAMMPIQKGLAVHRASPKLSPMLSPSMAPSPALVLRSPSLVPISRDNRLLTEDQITALATKSNYQNLSEGSAE